MKILRWWKTIQMEPWASFEACPKQELNEEQACFKMILDAIRKSDFDYMLVEEFEVVLEHRGDLKK